MKLSIKDIAGALGLGAPVFDAEIGHLLTDSRSLESPEDTLFFAIPATANDGHHYIADLYARCA